VHRENLLINDCCDRKAVEAVSKGLPKLNVISSLALVVESIDTVDGSAFVVAAEDEKVLWVFDFVCQQKADGLKRLLASVDVVAEEEVVCFWRETSILEKTEEIVVLAVNITADLVSTGNQHIALTHTSNLTCRHAGYSTYLDRSLKL
jgi:hypothetical protein